MKVSPISYIFALSQLLRVISAGELGWYYYKSQYVVTACSYGLSNVAIFNKKDTAKSFVYKCNPKSKAAFGSMIYCLYEEAGEYNEDIDEAFIGQCEENDIEITTDEIHAAYANVTKYIVNAKDIPGFNKPVPINTPVKYSTKAYGYSYLSEYRRWQNFNISFFIGFGAIAYWVLICAVAAFIKWGNKLGWFNNSLFTNKFTKTVQKYIGLPALYKRRHADTTGKLGWIGIVPTRLESLIIFAFTLYLALGCSLNIYPFFENDTIWKNHYGQIGRYVGDRSGVIVTFTFLFSFLFAGRNNFLIWFTGFKHSTFVTFHRWISRLNFILSLVHGVAMYYQSVGLGKLASRTATYWYRAGIAATLAAGLIVVFASYVIRRGHYEIFMVTHWLLIIAFTIATAFHLHKFGYDGFTYAFVVTWAFDRIVRLARSFAFGIQKAHIKLVSDETLKIRVSKRGFWKAFPGSYGYVTFYTWICVWQSHPFSLIEEDANTVTLHVKVKGGITSRLYKMLSKLPNFEITLNISIEGPYGDEKPLHNFDTALLYAGGNGIPSMYAYAKKLSEKGAVKNIKLYWGIREWKSIDWFYEELVKLRELPVQVVVYVSKPTSEVGSIFEKMASDSSSLEDSSDNNEKKYQSVSHETIVKALSFIEFRHGRVNIDELVTNDFKENSEGSIAVMSIGHSSMVDDIRYTVSQNVGLVKGQVEYYEELQSM